MENLHWCTHSIVHIKKLIFMMLNTKVTLSVYFQQTVPCLRRSFLMSEIQRHPLSILMKYFASATLLNQRVFLS